MVRALQVSDLPATEETVGLMSAYMRRALAADMEPDMDTVVEQVRNHMTRNAVKVLGKLPPAMLKKMLGPEVMKALREHDLGEVRGVKRQAPPQPEQKHANGTKERQMLSEREWEQKVFGRTGH